MYTLEKHLDKICSENPQFEILSAIWKLNKRQLPLAQSAISFNFPHYSLHEKSHSDTIIKNIESFLGEDRINKLSPTDAWMIMMSAYTHDLGMVVFHSAIEDKWTEDSFQNYLRDLSVNSSDKDLRNYSELLLEIEGESLALNRERIKLPLEVRKAVILIVADFFRRSHHIRSQEIIVGRDKKFSELVNGFNMDGIPSRFANILADIAYSHGTDFYSIIDKLEYQSDGFGNDKMHPRFIACMLRLGDLLDIDDKRFNIFNEKVLSHDLPHVSALHREKHASTRHLLICPESIEATVDCKTDEIYRIAREWFDWLQQEVQNQSREWTNIVPRMLDGMPPTISKGRLKVLYNSVEPKKELMNLRFAISNRKVFEMFEGSAIYENAEFVFLRELVQNAIDASKIQLWKLIDLGLYDQAIRKHLHLPVGCTHEQVKGSIIFPNDLPLEVFENFQVSLEISWLDEQKNDLKIEIRDNGTGISEKDLIRMTGRVGESRGADKEYNDFKNRMPYWMRPTGAFGIGLQSLFLLVPSFKVQTKSENEPGREIIFQSAKRGEYCKITSADIKFNRGTIVSLVIPRNKFEDVFSRNFDSAIIDDYDYFTDSFGDIYMHKIKHYIQNQFECVWLLNVKMFDVLILESQIGKRLLGASCPEILGSDRKSDFDCILYKDEEYSHRFEFSENFIVGSDIQLFFFDEFGKWDVLRRTIYNYSGRNEYYVRDMPVKQNFPNFFLNSYCGLAWNLQSPESDKILNISRDKLITKVRSKYQDKFLHKFMPRAIEVAKKIFEDVYGANINNNENVAIEYFHIELTAAMLQLPINSFSNIYNDFILPASVASKIDFSSISLREFLQETKFCLIDKRYKMYRDAEKETLQSVWERIDGSSKFNEGTIIWDKEYFTSYLQLGDFFMTHYQLFKDQENDVELRILVKSGGRFISVQANEYARKSLLSPKYLNNYSKRRKIIYGLIPYSNVIGVKNVGYDGFEEMPFFSNVCIISPFKSKNEFLKITTDLKDRIGVISEEELLKEVIRSYINGLVPILLSDWIIENTTSLDKTNLNREAILESYAKLLVDMLLLNRSVE